MTSPSVLDEDGEDDHSLQLHQATMKRQMERGNNFDRGIVQDRMLRTFAHRRQMVTSGAKLGDVLDTYPALQDQEQVRITTAIPMIALPGGYV